MKTDPGGNGQIKQKHLDSLFNLVIAQIVIANEGSEQGVKTGKCLSPRAFALERIKKVDGLT